jgi:RNA polymerase sigma-70 factor, ECF subfamily
MHDGAERPKPMPPDPSHPSPGHTTHVQTLFIKHSSLIKGFILAILPDFSLVDDVLQEVFLVVTEKAGSFEPGTSFLAWTRAIARNKVLELQRTRKMAARMLAPEVIESLCSAPPGEDFADLTEARAAALRQCMEKLAPQAKRIVEMRYREAHRPAEIANRLTWTPQAVHVALSRARATLRECVQRKLARDEAC